MNITSTLRALVLAFLVLGALGGENPRSTSGTFTVIPSPVAPAPSLAPVQAVKGPYWRPVWVKVTAYSPFDAIDSAYRLLKGKDRWKTSQGVDVRWNHYGVAADPRILPYGTHINIPGYMDESHPGEGWAVDDTGGKLRQAWADKRVIALDVRFWTSYSVKNWGVKWQWVYVWVAPDSQLERQLQVYDRRVGGRATSAH